MSATATAYIQFLTKRHNSRSRRRSDATPLQPTEERKAIFVLLLPFPFLAWHGVFELWLIR